MAIDDAATIGDHHHAELARLTRQLLESIERHHDTWQWLCFHIAGIPGTADHRFGRYRGDREPDRRIVEIDLEGVTRKRTEGFGRSLIDHHLRVGERRKVDGVSVDALKSAERIDAGRIHAGKKDLRFAETPCRVEHRHNDIERREKPVDHRVVRNHRVQKRQHAVIDRLGERIARLRIAIPAEDDHFVDMTEKAVDVQRRRSLHGIPAIEGRGDQQRRQHETENDQRALRRPPRNVANAEFEDHWSSPCHPGDAQQANH